MFDLKAIKVRCETAINQIILDTDKKIRDSLDDIPSLFDKVTELEHSTKSYYNVSMDLAGHVFQIMP